MISIPFYQTEWNGVDLKSIRAALGMTPGELPSSAFYERYYQTLTASALTFSDSWLEKKAGQSAWLRDQIECYGGRAAKVLSVGAGTGVVEKPMIADGYSIDLQDFQAESFKNLGVDQLTNCYSSRLSEIGKTYDIVFSCAVTYALSDRDLEDLLADIYSVLKPGGVFVWLDASLSWYEIYSYLRNRKYLERETVLWGYKRSLSSWRRMASAFTVRDQGYYDIDMDKLSLRSFAGLPLNVTPSWQLMVIQK